MAQYFTYYHHENMGNNDDVLSQNLQVMVFGNFQVKKGNPLIHQPGRRLRQQKLLYSSFSRTFQRCHEFKSLK